jgi:hypothetical protein
MQLTKKKTAILALALIFCIGIASAALLEYYAKIETTVNVAQGILVDGHGYETPITEEVSATGGGIVYTVHTIQNLGDKEATVYLSWETSDSDGLDVAYFVNTATLTLENKNPDTWQVIEDDTYATLTYCIVGNTFAYKLEAFGLEPNTEYSLIYYADKYPFRFENWGGDNPGALIGTAKADEHGYISTSGNIDLAMDLPSPPDANIDKYDYSGDPDYYEHAHGAKIWLVPSNDYDAEAKKMTAWNPTTYLFETDLIVYIDLDASTHLLHPDPEPVTAITVPAHSTVSFAIRFDFAENAYGTYLVTTTVSPPE